MMPEASWTSDRVVGRKDAEDYLQITGNEVIRLSHLILHHMSDHRPEKAAEEEWKWGAVDWQFYQ